VGRHFLQIPGPTNVPDRVLRAIDNPTIDHRGPVFAALGRQKELVFTARAVDAEEALAIGLATEVVADAEARVAQLCELLASHAAVTLRVTKEALRRLRPVPDGDDLVREAYGSAEFRERVAAFLSR
jgi:enoyl-CoA hydratase/carnithine racemase